MSRLFLTNYYSLLEKQVYFKVAITEIYPQLPWDMVADRDPRGCAKQRVGITGLWYLMSSEIFKAILYIVLKQYVLFTNLTLINI